MTTISVDGPDDDPHRAGIRLPHGSSSPSENWDDDFEFQAGTAIQPLDRGSDATNAPLHPERSQEQEESWDDAYEDYNTQKSPIKLTPKLDDDEVEDWDSSDNEHETHNEHNHEHRNDSTREFGFSGFEEEDKTVTARSTSSRPPYVPPPPLPIPLPSSTLPFQAHTVLPSSTTSPTLSTFSIPLSSTTRDRTSIYSEDPLMPTSNSSAPHLLVIRTYPHAAGSTPPRKGRRLRKKSRPPEADIFELEDREPDPVTAPPSIPVVATQIPAVLPTTPPRAQHATLESPSHPSQPNAPATPSPSLLTRISSLKRWARRSIGPDDPPVSGWRRSKSSAGPSEAKSSHDPSDVIVRGGKSSLGPEGIASVEEDFEVDLRAISPTPAPGSKARRSRGDSASGQKSGWFFRAGGAVGSDRSESNPIAQAPELTPKRGTTLGLRRRNNMERDEGQREGSGEGKTLTPRKPNVKLVPTLKVGGSSGFLKHGQPESPARPARRSSSQDGTESQLHSESRPMSMPFPRHGSASVGRNAGMPLSISISADATLAVSVIAEGKDKAGQPREERDKQGGMRALVNGVRRLSLVGAGHGHKRTKSTSGEAAVVEAVRNDAVSRGVVPEPVTQQGEETGLLPPVELEPPRSGSLTQRGSLPWADYDPSPGGEALAGVSLPGPAYLPPSKVLPAPQRQSLDQRSLSTSASSLLGGSSVKSSLSESPTKTAAQSAIVPVSMPKPPAADSAPPSSRSATTSPGQTGPRPPTQSQAASRPQSPGSPVSQSASLGRFVTSPSQSAGLRRNSLGDLKSSTSIEHAPQLPPLVELKIPARISRAQQGLRRDLGMVREFAGCVEQLKQLQATHASLIAELRATCESSPVSPTAAQVQFHLPSRPPSQTGMTKKAPMTNSNLSTQNIHQAVCLNSPTQPFSRSISRASHDVSREIARLEHEYGIWWECAELLVELGGGSKVAAGTASNPNLASHSVSTVNIVTDERLRDVGTTEELPVFLRSTAPVTSLSEPSSLFEHAPPPASTVKGPPQASPPHPSQWRASTGRHDLSARQLRLLKDMLNTPDPSSLAYAAGPYGYDAGCPHPHPHPYYAAEVQPWAAWNPSALTLPSEDSSADVHGNGAGGVNDGQGQGREKKRRSSRLGMLGLREILRGLKRNASAEGKFDAGGPRKHAQQQDSESSMSNSADDDHYNRRRSPWHQHDEHHMARQSTSPEAIVAIQSPPARIPPKSPRRPSLASIFRIGQKANKTPGANGKYKDPASSGNGTSTTEDEQRSASAAGEYLDWERMSRSDVNLNAINLGTATVRGKKIKAQASHSIPNLHHPYTNTTTPKKSATSSQTSLRESSPSATSSQPSRLPLSIAEEGSGLYTQISKKPRPARAKERTSSWSQAYPPRPASRTGKAAMSGTVRSAPPTDLSSSTPEPQLALTPENIKPLLEYAREVSTRLSECVGEVQMLLDACVAGSKGF